MLIKIREYAGCTLWQGADRYVLRGATGEHSLDRESTDSKRLEAHWKGFLENQPKAATFAEFVEQVKQLSRDNVKAAKRNHGGYIRPRELRISGMRDDCNVGNAWYVSASKLTQKFLKLAILDLRALGAERFFVDVGADWYESMQAAVEGWDYDPDVEADSIEVPPELARAV